MLAGKVLKDSIVKYVEKYLQSTDMEVEVEQLMIAYSFIPDDDFSCPEEAFKCLQSIHLGLAKLPWPTHPKDLSEDDFTQERDVHYWKCRFFGGSDYSMDTWLNAADKAQQEHAEKTPFEQWQKMVESAESQGYNFLRFKK